MSFGSKKYYNAFMSLPADLIEQLIPEPLPTIEQIEAKYPPRSLAEGQKVSRIGPSPTGFVHIGTVFMSLVNDLFVHQNEPKGVFFVRIEDTDQKREMEGATEMIIKTLADYGIRVDEGPTLIGGKVSGEKGAYGPYIQSKRGDIYKAYAKKLLREGKAYPCFCTSEELEALRNTQEQEGTRPGYYGKWAFSRNLTEEEIRKNLADNKSFVIRLRSEGNGEKMMKIADVVKGERFLPENDLDIVILKSEGLPTYHFAHVVDDHFMGTTHVLRGDEWLNSVPLHLQLFGALGWKAPKYGHLSPLQKLDEGNRRKLSKRKDPEASMGYFEEHGYPRRAVLEYLLNLANSNFEDWRRANPMKPYEEFEFALKKLGNTGALFDFVKLDNVSKEFIARMSAEDIFRDAHAWAKQYNANLLQLMESDATLVKNILNIERTGTKARKDITTWASLPNELEYFFDAHFKLTKEEAIERFAPVADDDARAVASKFAAIYSADDDKDAWFEKVKKLAEELGYAANVKDAQANPGKYKGNVSDIAKVLRVLLTGRAQTPDLHSVMKVLGKERCLKRLALLLA